MKFIIISVLFLNSYFNCNFISNKEYNIELNHNYEDCTFKSQDYQYDLSNLKKLDDLSFYKTFEFKASFCRSLNNKCFQSTSPAGYFQNNVCFGYFSKNWNALSAEYYLKDNPNSGLKLNFGIPGSGCASSFDKMNYLIYSIKCDYTKEITFEDVNKIDICKYEFVFSSKYACPISSSITSYSILKFMLIVGLIYIIVFTYINFKNNPEDGLMKAFPNREFLGYFFECVVEGFRVTSRIFEKDNHY